MIFQYIRLKNEQLIVKTVTSKVAIMALLFSVVLTTNLF